MFDLKPIETSDFIGILQLVVVIAGFRFTWVGLNATRRSMEAQQFQSLISQSRVLQTEFIDAFFQGNDEQKQAMVVGKLIGHHSFGYELRQIVPLPDSVAKLFDSELKELMAVPQVKAHWEKVKGSYGKGFINHVDNVRRGQ